MEEIYKDLSSPKSKEFEKLLNSEFAKSKIEEGKICEGTITKITNKLVFIDCGGKSEGTLDINEIKLLKEEGSLVLGSKISVLVVKLEDKKGDLVIIPSVIFPSEICDFENSVFNNFSNSLLFGELKSL